MSDEERPYRNLTSPAWLRGSSIAHRGLHDEASGIVENSMSAFEAAIEAGYGIECDVRLSADREPIIFHDLTLERLTDATGPLAANEAAELTALKLKGTDETVPRLADLLDLANRRVPLLIELKSYDGDDPKGALEAAVAKVVAGYGGPLAVMSFLPATVDWFRRHAPHLPRGFLSEDYRRSTDVPLSAWRKFMLRTLLAAVPADPAFIGYEVSALGTWPPRLVRLCGIPVFAWTVKDETQAREATRVAHSIIFEGFRPPPHLTSL